MNNIPVWTICVDGSLCTPSQIQIHCDPKPNFNWISVVDKVAGRVIPIWSVANVKWNDIPLKMILNNVTLGRFNKTESSSLINIDEYYLAVRPEFTEINFKLSII